ncbi:MAG TPA: hypothetical protein VGM02_09955 [Acidobacteriaceae bacterium]|jgi:hypothetical protein
MDAMVRLIPSARRWKAEDDVGCADDIRDIDGKHPARQPVVAPDFAKSVDAA